METASKNTGIPKQMGHVMMVPFQEYIVAKETWKREHHKARIKEEMKNVFLGMVEVPDPILIGKTKQEQQVMVIWAIVYEE